jgi:outer membrane protein assembly factor BamB
VLAEHLHAFDAASGEEPWRVQTGEGIDEVPLIANGTVYLCIDRDGGRYIAIDPATGAERWRIDRVGLNGLSAAIDGTDGVAYVGREGGLYALDAATGSELWHVDTELGVDRVEVVGGVVYAESYSPEGDVYLLRAVGHDPPSLGSAIQFNGKGDR